MSRFKFRIWDKTKNEWLGASDKNSVAFKGFDLCGETLRLQQLPMDIEDKSKYVVEESVDLTDDEGIPIYEGDIIKSNGDEIGVIKYCEGLWLIEWNSVGSSDLGDFSFEFNALQVIGNIHENPELIPKTLRGFYD